VAAPALDAPQEISVSDQTPRKPDEDPSNPWLKSLPL
jgi:hypothetical protein